jgi:WD40 repeat protein
VSIFVKVGDPASLPASQCNAPAFSPGDAYLAVPHAGGSRISIYKRSGTSFTKLSDPDVVLSSGNGLSVAFSNADGTYLALTSDSFGNYLTIYKRDGDAFTKLSEPDTPPAGPTAACAFSPDDTYLAVGTNQFNKVIVYKRTGDAFANLSIASGPTGYVSGLAWSPDGVYLAAAHDNSPYITIYKRTGDSFTPLSDPAVLPTGHAGNGRGAACAFSDDGRFLTVAHADSPFITIYERSGDTFTKLDAPRIFEPAGNVNGVAWNHATNRVAAAHATTPFAASYNTDSGVFERLADPGTLPASTGNGAAWNPDGSSLAIGHNTTPFVTIYNRSGDTLTKLSNPASLPASTSRKPAWNHDGSSLAVPHTTTPFVTIYNRSSDTFSKITNPANLPAGNGQATAWNHDGSSLAVAHATTPFITVYDRSGDTFTKLTNPANLPPFTSNGVAWNHDGSSLAVAHGTSPFVTIYNRSGGTLTKITNPSNLPASTGRDAAWSPSGSHLAIAHDNSPFITVYERSGDTFTKLANPSSLPAGNGLSVAWNADGSLLLVGFTGAPYLAVYRLSGSTLTRVDPSELPTDTGISAAFSPSARHLAVSGADDLIRILSRDDAVFRRMSGEPDTQNTTDGAVAFGERFLAVGSTTATPKLTIYEIQEPMIAAILAPASAMMVGFGAFVAALDGAQARFNPLNGMHANLGDASALFSDAATWLSTLADATAAIAAAGFLASPLAAAAADFVGAGALSSELSPASAAIALNVYEPVSDSIAMQAGGSGELVNTLREIVQIAESYSPQGVFSVSRIDSVVLVDVIRLLVEAFAAEDASFTDVVLGDPFLIGAVIDELQAIDSTISQQDGIGMLSIALVLSDLADPALLAEIQDLAEFTAAIEAKANLIAALLSEILADPTAEPNLARIAVSSEMLALLATPSTVVSMSTAARSDAAFDVAFLINGDIYTGWVFNAETMAPSEYANFTFESMAGIAGRYYGAGPDGLFLLDGDDDAGVPIEARIRTGELDFGSPMIKRIEEAFIGYTATGDLVLKLVWSRAGKRKEHWYLAKNPVPGEPTETRVVPGKGLESRYFQMELANVNGADFEIDRLDLVPINLSRMI